ncbi:hypothetical protein ANCDUO_12324 [Ancylostoma duodenale]|uniref:Uncharacterized protein n=1 Tax=Ancylostoma duodenale TaxID=51022 RepID=A0A0C2G948_9BILA|nr:hypothetical protein ANCDUO_12324 [Ancylostoma duodenale]
MRCKLKCLKHQCHQPGTPCKIGYLMGTFFEVLRDDRKKIFLTSYLFAYDARVMEGSAQMLKVDEKHPPVNSVL